MAAVACVVTLVQYVFVARAPKALIRTGRVRASGAAWSSTPIAETSERCPNEEINRRGV